MNLLKKASDQRLREKNRWWRQPAAFKRSLQDLRQFNSINEKLIKLLLFIEKRF
jgi:hypothetical protein